MMAADPARTGRYVAVIDLQYLDSVTPVFVAKDLGLKPRRPDGKPSKVPQRSISNTLLVKAQRDGMR